MHHLRLYRLAPLLSLIILLTSSPLLAQPNDETAIRALIESYGKAMNASNVDDVLSLFTKNAVFMPDNEPTAVGYKQIKEAYEHEFKAIDLDVKIEFDEIEYNDSLAYVRTRSNGTLKILAKNKVVSTEAYRAFFILEKQQNQWRIARFMFNFNVRK